MWTQDIIESLAVFKAEGLTFAESWEAAVEMYPPRGRDLGPAAPSLLEEDESPAEFLRHVADDAWHGRCPVLRHLTNAMELIEQADEPRVVVGRGAGQRAHLAGGDT